MSREPGAIHTYAYVGGNPISFVDPMGLETATVTNYGLASAKAGRPPDFIQFSVYAYVINISGTFSRTGNSFFGGGVGRGYPNPVGLGASITAGWLNDCNPSDQKVDDFIGGWGFGKSAFFMGAGGGIAWSPGNGTATIGGLGAGVSLSLGSVQVNQGNTGLGW